MEEKNYAYWQLTTPDEQNSNFKITKKRRLGQKQSNRQIKNEQTFEPAKKREGLNMAHKNYRK